MMITERFLDAYSNNAVLKFYEANGFHLLFSTERQEKLEQ
jgi:hypothetical protein